MIRHSLLVPRSYLRSHHCHPHYSPRCFPTTRSFAIPSNNDTINSSKSSTNSSSSTSNHEKNSGRTTTSSTTATPRNSNNRNSETTTASKTSNNERNQQQEMSNVMKAFFQDRDSTNRRESSSLKLFNKKVNHNSSNSTNHNSTGANSHSRKAKDNQRRSRSHFSQQQQQQSPFDKDNSGTNANDSIRAFFQNRSSMSKTHNTSSSSSSLSTFPHRTSTGQQQQQLPQPPSQTNNSSKKQNNRGKFPWDLKPLQQQKSKYSPTETREFPSFLDKYKTSTTAQKTTLSSSSSSTTTTTTTTASQTNPTALPRPPPRSGVGLAAPSTPEPFTSPLSEMIRQMQLAQQQKQQQNNETNTHYNTSTSTTTENQNDNEPRWRTSSLRSLRNASKSNNTNNNHYNANKTHEFLQSDHHDKARQQQQRKRQRQARKRQPIQVTIPSYDLSLVEASQLFRQSKRQIERILRQLGATNVTTLDRELLELVASECSHIQVVDPNDLETNHENLQKDKDRLTWPTRPPVVTVMGHVDHGKTTLMDALRRRAQESQGGLVSHNKGKNYPKSSKGKKSNTANGDIAGTEAGGITQVISAFQVALEGTDSAVTFLDTPGHAAFRNMRRSGSEAADVIVLVVAAEDGLAAQSLEIIQFYKSLLEQDVDISLVVAMNKIDQPGINLEECQYRLENQLLQEGILVEGMPQTSGDFWGSPVPLYPISAKEGTGLDDLVEGLVLQSEIMDLRSPSDEAANGILLDARIEKGLGVVVDAIIRSGSLKKGDLVVSGEHKGRVRILKTTQGNSQINEAVSSQPVRIMGFDSLPNAGDLFRVVESEDVANEVIEREKALKDTAESRPITAASTEIQGSGKDTLDKNWQSNLKEKYQIEEGDKSVIRIPIVLKASADGTLMALQEALHSLIATSKYKLQLDVVQMAVGPVSENDMQLASESGAMILGFDVKVPSFNEMDVPVFQSKVIYTLLDSARDAMAQNYLPPTTVEQVHGKADVQAVFSIGGMSTKIAGLRVLQGRLYRQKANGVAIQYRVLGKDKKVKHSSGRVTSLKHFKQDVEEVTSGQECGLALEGYDQYEDGDIIECFSVASKYEFN